MSRLFAPVNYSRIFRYYSRPIQVYSAHLPNNVTPTRSLTRSSPLSVPYRQFNGFAENYKLCIHKFKPAIWEASQCQRWYNRKKTLRTGPTTPLTFDYAGDLDPKLPELDMSKPKPGFDLVTDLEMCDDVVQQLFSLEFADGRALREKHLELVLSKIREHPADVASLEVKIASATVFIRNQMRHMLEFRKDKVTKMKLINRIHRRRRNLGRLQEMDIEKYEWIQEELKLKHMPIPMYNRKDSRRAKRKRIAREGAIGVKRAKMDEFKELLEKEKAKFVVEKERELDRIGKELKEYGIEKMESLEQVFSDLKLGPPYVVKKEKRKSRRQKLLEMKFKLYASRRYSKVAPPSS